MNRFENTKKTKEAFRPTRTQKIMKEHAGDFAVTFLVTIVTLMVIGFFTVVGWFL